MLIGPPPTGIQPDASEARKASLTATPFVYRSPLDIPRRDWLYGHHLIRRNISVTVAPGGLGKSSLTVVQALELAASRRLLGPCVPPEPLRVWLFNLEDERTELDRRFAAAMQHYGLGADDIAGRLFVDTGREQELVLAEQVRDNLILNGPVIERLTAEIRANHIDVLILDPFVSSHRVNEMDNGKIDAVAKQWIKVAEDCACAVELVHHTRKLNGMEASSDASRGASSLINAARSARVLQRLSDDELQEAGVADDGSTYFSVKRDKSNLAAAGRRETYRTVSVELGQGDSVGVVEAWEKPSAFAGLSDRNLLQVQQALEDGESRANEQAAQWGGYVVAEVLGLDGRRDRKRLKALLRGWLESGALTTEKRSIGNGKMAEFLAVGEWVNSR